MTHTTQSYSFSEVTTEDVSGYTIGLRNNPYQPHQKTILLIHGIGVSSAYYVPLAQQLSKSYNVFALDLPGYGKSPKPKKPLTIEQLAKVTQEFIAKHSLTDVTLVGHSMGCQIVAEAHTQDSTRIQNMILMSPTANYKERSVLMQGMRLFQDTLMETPKANFVIFSNYIRMGVIRYFQTAQWMVRNYLEKNLEGISTPTLLIRGTKDPIAPHSWLEYLKRQSDAITIREVPGAPHAVQFSFPKEVAKVCIDFIEAL